MNKLSDEQKASKVRHFRRIIKYRSWLGWVFAVIGVTLMVFGLKNEQNLIVILNGFIFFGYGLFMVWQSKRAQSQMSNPSR